MKIKQGATRIVILIGNMAIKIGKVRILRFTLRMISFPFSKYQRNRFYQKYGDAFWKAARQDILFGVLANRNEYRYYQETRDKRVVPTLKLFLGGLVVIQEKGKEVDTCFLSNIPFIQLHPAEMGSTNQFCVLHDSILLADYGHSETCRILRETL